MSGDRAVITLSQSAWHVFTARHLRFALASSIILGLGLLPRQVSTAQAGGQWYKVDTHVHSSVSADAFVDIGIHSQAAIENGYDAIFLTDHNGGSSFQINNLTANHMIFDDSYTRWDVGTYGTLSATTNALVTTPVKTGIQSLHLRSSSAGVAETYIWTKRGPNLRSGDIILNVSIYPTRIDPGSGLYVSVSIGGDPTVISSPHGYTTAAGMVSPGKSTVLVWQLGSGRAPSSDPNARVITYSLGNYTLNAWNDYTIDVSDALADIPVADLPLDYNGLTYLKLTAASNGGTVEGYFDAYSIDASSPVSPADEYVYRTSIVDDFNTSTFKVFPSYEMGQQKHTNRFNFGITDPSQYRSYTYGSDGIEETQLSGYPAQLNHPGTTVTEQEAIAGQGLGADFLEVRDQPWIDVWDAILQQGTIILGHWSSDTHSGLSAGKAATYIYAPALSFNELIHSLYEGRTYNAANNFSGRIILNLSSASQEPYPARYPVYVSRTQSAIDVHLGIPSGISPSYNVYWFRNGELFATDSVTGSSYDVLKSIPLDGATTYVRAELRLVATGAIRAMTQPIFFKDVSNLPADKQIHVDGVTTANGRGYTRTITKGITATNWNSTNQTLSLTLENATGSLVRMLMRTNSGPQQIVVNGLIILPANSLTAFEAATGSSWYYQSTGALLYLKVKHASGAANVVANFSGMPPSSPTATATATPMASEVTVNVWVGISQLGSHSVGKGKAMQASYAGVNQGPLKMMSTTTDTIVGSEAVIYSLNGTGLSFSETMGLPNSQLDNVYWLPWYNNKDLDTQLRFANVSGSTATVHVSIGGVEMTGSPFTLAPGASLRRSFTGIDRGPVKIASNVNIVAAERVIYTVNGSPTSFSEMMALPASQLDKVYWLPWYNNK